MAQGDGDSRGTQVRSAWAGQVGVVVMRRRGAEKRGLFRLVDESGEDYLYPKDLFAVVDLPSAVTRKLAVAT